MKFPEASPQAEARQPPVGAQAADFGLGVPVANPPPELEAQSGVQNPKSKIENGKSAVGEAGDPSQNPKSNRKPYVKTPARVAAARANLEKARAAPKTTVYRLTDKRLAANRANLAKAKALRQQEREQVVDYVDVAFPPLYEQIEAPSPSAESAEPPMAEVAANGACPSHHSSSADRIAEGSQPEDSRNAPDRAQEGADPLGGHGREASAEGAEPPGGHGRDASAHGRDQGRDARATSNAAPRKIWMIGWPNGREGVDRSAPGYPELEKLGRTIVRRRRTVHNEARREGRQVMRLLTQAAERTVAPALEEILSLACGLISVLVNSRLRGRVQRLNRRVKKLLAAFLQKRYGDTTGEVYDWMAEVRQIGEILKKEKEFSRQMEEDLRAQGYLPRPKRKPRARPKPKPEKEACAGGQAPSQQPCGPEPAGGEPVPATGPDLPQSFEEFRALFRRAFFAPNAEAEDKGVSQMVDALANSLWRRLHRFEVGLQSETKRLDQALDEMAQTLPQNSQDLRRRHARIRVILDDSNEEQELRAHTREFRWGLRIVMSMRYGPRPEIDRFDSTSDKTVEGSRSKVES